MDVEIACGQAKKHRRRPAYDWDGLITKEGKETFRQLVKEIPDQPWDTDIHVHWQRLEDGIHQGLLKYFPAKKKETHHTVFSSQTLETLQSRKQAKRILDQVDEELRGLTLQAGFETWRDPIPLTMAMDVRRLRRMALVLCHCFGLRRFREAASCVRKAIKEDKANYISATVERAQQAHGVDIFKELAPLRIGGKFRKRGATTLSGFSFNGEQARDHLHNEDLWLRYCATLEAGVATSTSRLVQNQWTDWQDLIPLEDAPSLVHLEGAFRHVAKGKAGGADGFLSNVCYAAPKELAQKFFPVMLKMMATLEEPIQAKGGVLVAAFKGGVASNPEDHRSLLLSSHLGKSVRRAIRQQLIGPYSTTTPDTFFSIRQGGSVSHASQALRLYAGAKAHRGESTGILFLDVKAAYYRIIRQLAVRGREQHSIERVMEHFDLGATDLQELLSEIHNIPDYDGSNFTKHQELMLEELLSSTWFTAQHRSRLYESLAGSRPGDGLADLVFGIVFKRILQRVTERLKDILQIEDTEINGDVSLIESGGEIREAPQLLQAVWADDLAVCFSRKGAHQLVEDMAKVTSVVFQECLRHGLIPNLKKEKSEILLLLRGEGSRSAKAMHLNGQEPRLWIPEVPEDFQWVNLVHTYKHLGTRVHISLKLMSEIKARCGQAGSTYRKHRRQIFQNPRLSRDKRVYLFGSMVMSILEFNVGTRGKLNKSEWAYYKKRVMGLYRGLARAEIPEEDLTLWSHDKILAFLRVPSPEVLLHVSRLRYMISLWNSAPATLLHLIGAQQSWLGELQESQHWMEEQLRGYGPDSNGHPWSGWRCGGGQAMKSWIKKAKQIAILRHTRRVEWREFHFEYLNECRQAGWMHEFPWPDGQEFVDEQQLEACMACGLVFKNRAAWSVHAFRAHARRNPRRRVIGGTRCDACAREYRSTARLLNHLRNSDSCYRQLLHAGKVYEDILPGIGSRNEIRGGPMPVPVMRSQGPREEGLTGEFPDGELEEERYDLTLMDNLIDCFLAMPSHTTLPEGLDLVKQCVEGNTARFSFLRKTMHFFVEELNTEEMHLEWKIPHSLVTLIAQTAANRFKISWFFAKDRLRAPVDDETIREAAWNYCKSNVGPWRWEKQEYIPRFGCHCLIWLHLFSGERRADDLQSQLESLRAPPGYVLRILLVDVIFDPIAGNLACPKNQRIWLGHIDAGFVAGLMAGPPCESWSRARVHGGVAGWSTGTEVPKFFVQLNFQKAWST